MGCRCHRLGGVSAVNLCICRNIVNHAALVCEQHHKRGAIAAIGTDKCAIGHQGDVARELLAVATIGPLTLAGHKRSEEQNIHKNQKSLFHNGNIFLIQFNSSKSETRASPLTSANLCIIRRIARFSCYFLRYHRILHSFLQNRTKKRPLLAQRASCICMYGFY